MPKPYQRTRSMKRHTSRMPSSSGLTIHYERARAKTAHCAQCGRTIFTAVTGKPSMLRKLPLTKKRPQRVFGGELCHACLLESLKQAARETAS